MHTLPHYQLVTLVVPTRVNVSLSDGETVFLHKEFRDNEELISLAEFLRVLDACKHPPKRELLRTVRFGLTQKDYLYLRSLCPNC